MKKVKEKSISKKDASKRRTNCGQWSIIETPSRKKNKRECGLKRRVGWVREVWGKARGKGKREGLERKGREDGWRRGGGGLGAAVLCITQQKP